jgi:hypothetical protein
MQCAKTLVSAGLLYTYLQTQSHAAQQANPRSQGSLHKQTLCSDSKYSCSAATLPGLLTNETGRKHAVSSQVRQWQTAAPRLTVVVQLRQVQGTLLTAHT